jgi:hypothetical protein
MLEPRMRENPMQPSENINQMLHAGTSIIQPITSRQAQSAGENLLTGNNIRRPI